jgi:multidrug efflux system membrane fusion protein
MDWLESPLVSRQSLNEFIRRLDSLRYIYRRFQYDLMIFACLLCVSLCAGCSKVESYEKPLTPVRTQAVEQQYVSGGAARYSANIQPNTQLDLAFKAGGYVEEILSLRGRIAQEGDWIAKGTTIARIRNNDYAARVKQARAQLAEAQAAQAQARSQLAEAEAAQDNTKRELDRATRLLEGDSITKPDYEAIKAKFDVGQARIESIKAQITMAQARADAARAQVEEAEGALSDCELKSPMAGLLLKRNIEIGSFVTPGAPAFTLADTSSVKAVFGVPDVTAPGLKIGSFLTVTTEAAPGVEFRGQLNRVSPSADPKTRIFDVEVAVSNPRRRLKPGMVVSLEVAGERQPTPVTVAPLAALLQIKEKDSGYAVYVVTEESGKQIAKLRHVQTGRTLGNSIVVTNGVNAGEQVIVSGATLVSDGEQVRVIP